MESLFFVILPYLCAALFLFGVVWKFYTWLRTPVPLRIVTTPAPKTRLGVAGRLIADLLWFPTLFKADRVLWAGALLFHLAFWLILLRHLRYFLLPIPQCVDAVQTVGLYAGYLLPVAAAFLLVRRLVVDRLLYVSALGDYFALLLLLTVTVSGVLLQLFFRTYIIDVKAMILGLVHFRPVVLPVHWLFVVHLAAVMLLLAYFPFGKLLHSGGLLLSPTRYRRASFDGRLINPWDTPVSYRPENLSPPEKYAAALAEGKKA